MKKTLRFKLVGGCFLALFTVFTAFSIAALADEQDGSGTGGGKTSPAPTTSGPPPTDAGGGPAAVALFLAGAAGLAALQKKRTDQRENRT